MHKDESSELFVFKIFFFQHSTIPFPGANHDEHWAQQPIIGVVGPGETGLVRVVERTAAGGRLSYLRILASLISEEFSASLLCPDRPVSLVTP